MILRIHNINDQSKVPLSSFFKFQASFKEIEEKYNTTLVFLVFSLVWSFKTCAKTSIKIKSDAKKFLPFFPKFILFWRYLFVFLIRVGCIVTYFAPFVGNLGVMNHYQAETLSLDPTTYNSFGSNSKLIFLNNEIKT